jgi:hypothetical protein
MKSRIHVTTLAVADLDRETQVTEPADEMHARQTITKKATS